MQIIYIILSLISLVVNAQYRGCSYYPKHISTQTQNGETTPVPRLRLKRCSGFIIVGDINTVIINYPLTLPFPLDEPLRS